MQTFSLADAKAHLSHLVELVEAGEEITITKRGKAVVRIVASMPPAQQLPSLAELRARQTSQPVATGEFIRAMRETDRY